DGKILIAGAFTTVAGTARNYIARLNTDGTLDSGFTPNVAYQSNTQINALALQADGKILIGGNFLTVGGTSHTYVARLNADGTVDNTFNAPLSGAPLTGVMGVVLQPDGGVLVEGLSNIACSP